MQINHETKLIRGGIISNFWLLCVHDKNYLIDTGFISERLLLKRFLRKHGVKGAGDLHAVLLTHRHSDHAGNAAYVQKKFNVPILIHHYDAPILASREKAPLLADPQKPLLHNALCRVEDALPAHCEVDRVVSAGEQVFGFQVIPVYGHTEGSCMFFHEDGEILFSGDVILAGIPPFTFFSYLKPADPSYTPQLSECYNALFDYLDTRLHVSVLASGHGPLVQHRLPQRLDRLKHELHDKLRELSTYCYH